MNHRSYGYGPGVKMKKTLSASHRYFSDLKIHFWCHLCRVLPVLKVNISFSLQKQLDKNSDPTDSTQPNFFRHKMLLKRPPEDRNHNMEFLAKKVHDNSLEMTVQRDTCSNNPEKPLSEPCKLLYAIPL